MRKSGQRKCPDAKMSDSWVKEFMSKQARFSWGKIAKVAGVEGVAEHRLYQHINAPQEEVDNKKEKAMALCNRANKRATLPMSPRSKL